MPDIKPAMNSGKVFQKIDSLYQNTHAKKTTTERTTIRKMRYTLEADITIPRIE
ncbi:hypothetical protein MUO83_02595 [Candidatus Bathyarchaeota archaeon]|nr:hypothetical protein [Candidatus Bathyarchaeota archaeon]